MLTLSDLQKNPLVDTKHIQMSCQLKKFPSELFQLANSLEVLDLSGNQLSSLPDDFYRFTKLRILFLSNNNFEVIPAVLSACPKLNMIGFKANQINRIPEESLPQKIRWLILTDNQLSELPKSIGQHTELQKLMLAGNHIKALPIEMQQCQKLELLRISANQLQELPLWLLQLPKLSWLAFAGNPCSRSLKTPDQLLEIHWDELSLGQPLGEGASGKISQAFWRNNFDVAVKEFKAAVTSDGFPADEIAATVAAGTHKHLMGVIAKLLDHPEKKSGLILPLIAEEFTSLASPPCLDSCTRDRYHKDTTFSLSQLLSMIKAIASVAVHLHQKSIVHGDLYAHNILIHDQHCLLGDFGAASLYDELSAELAHAIERIEVRAFGCLFEELLTHLEIDSTQQLKSCLEKLQALQQSCLHIEVHQRPSFIDIDQCIGSIVHAFEQLSCHPT